MNTEQGVPGRRVGGVKFLAGWGGVLVDATPIQEGKARACVCLCVCVCVSVCVCVGINLEGRGRPGWATGLKKLEHHWGCWLFGPLAFQESALGSRPRKEFDEDWELHLWHNFGRGGCQ